MPMTATATGHRAVCSMRSVDPSAWLSSHANPSDKTEERPADSQPTTPGGPLSTSFVHASGLKCPGTPTTATSNKSPPLSERTRARPPSVVGRSFTMQEDSPPISRTLLASDASLHPARDANHALYRRMGTRGLGILEEPLVRGIAGADPHARSSRRS
jgi:hypothetical protein